MESVALVRGLAPNLVPRWPILRRGGGAGRRGPVWPLEGFAQRDALHTSHTARRCSLNDTRASCRPLTPLAGPLDTGQLCILITMERARIDVG